MIDNVKERDIFEEFFYLLILGERYWNLAKERKNKRGSEFYLEENVAKKKKNVENLEVEDASRLMEWRMEQKRRGRRERVSSQFTASGCHKQNTFEKEGFEWKYSLEQYDEGDEKGRALN